MPSSFFVTGTGTDVGKTIVSSWLISQLRADYWKPIQSGLAEKDSDRVAMLAGPDAGHIHPETYLLKEPLSPHEAARREGVIIEEKAFDLPQCQAPLIVEGAGGVLVPLNEKWLMVDLMKRLALPVILVASTRLGTINHTLLSLEALRARQLQIAGVVLVGDRADHNREAIRAYGRVEILAHIPWLTPLNHESLNRILPPAIPFWSHLDV